VLRVSVLTGCANPQYQRELLVTSAARCCWNAYGAHQPCGDARRNQPFTTTLTPRNASNASPTGCLLCPLLRCQRSKSSGGRNSNGQNFNHPPTASIPPARTHRSRHQKKIAATVAQTTSRSQLWNEYQTRGGASA